MDIVITKIEAARRQLETAVALYFNDRDVVSIHTLAAAAHNVLADLHRRQGEGGAATMRGILETYVKEEHKKFVMDKFHEAENFFKHADRDPDAKLTFNTDQPVLVLWDAIVYHRTLTAELPPLFAAFNSWFMITHTELFNFPSEDKEPYLAAARSMAKLPKAQFLTEMLTVLNRM
jgi:hypothetical protein